MTNKTLLEKAKNTAQKNLLATSEGPAFSAGFKHFRTLWVRDFCFSVPGLLAGGFKDQVTNQLKLIYKFRNAQNLLPRGIDTVPPQLRVLVGTVFHFLPDAFTPWDKSPLKPEYLGEHKTPAFDSNILFLRALCDLHDFSHEEFLLSQGSVKAVLSWYDNHWKDGFLYQPGYSDWQDSAKRFGSLFHTQILYIETVHRLEKIFPGVKFHEDINHFEQTTFNAFFDLDVGLFREILKSDAQYALEAHVMVLTSPYIFAKMNKQLLYKTLKAHPLWNHNIIPGIPIYPPYKEDAVSWTTKIVGLRHYHDGFLWGWLIAEAVRAAISQKDFLEAERITKYFSEATKDHDYFAEIYEITNQSLKPVKRPLYRSECPFTWSAGKWLQALKV